MKRLMPVMAIGLLISTLAFTLPYGNVGHDMDTVRLRRVQTLKVTPKQYKALKANSRSSKVLNFGEEGQVSAKKGYALLQARNNSFLIWPIALAGKTNSKSAVHVQKAEGENGFTLNSNSDFFSGAPAGTGVMLACYCREGSGDCANFTEEGPDACTGSCCGLHGDLITPGGDLEVVTL